jgi:hypothetical protein
MDNDLNLPEPLYVKKGIAKDIDELEKKGDNIFSFDGLLEIETIFQLYLLKKYKSKCIPYSQVDVISGKRILGITLNLKLRYTSFEDENIRKHFTNLAKNIADCVKRGEKTIIIPLTYERSNSGHANILIYRRKTNELEHFEPHGSDYMGDIKLQEASKKLLLTFTNILNNELKKDNLPEVKYIEASQVCPYIEGLQILELKSELRLSKTEPPGYCAAWSMFFMELCLKNPDISSRDILTNIYNYLASKPESSNYLRKVIRGYSGYIYEKFEKYLSVFFKRKLNIDDIKIFYKKNDDERITKLREVLNILALLEFRMVTEPDFNLNNELKKTKKEFYNLTKGKTKEEIRQQMKTRLYLKNLYYKKRILQNYEEYDKYDRVSEPIIDSPLEIKREDIKNLNVLTKKIREIPEKKQKTIKNKSPKSKTIKNKSEKIIKNIKNIEIVT